MKTVAERLRFAREQRGWTQSQLAAASDVSQGTIGNIESGARQSRGSLPKIAKALGVSHDWLADGEGEMVPVGAIELWCVKRAPVSASFSTSSGASLATRCM